MQIFVKTLSGKTRVLNVKPDDSIYKIKEQISNTEGIPSDGLRLTLGGRVLWNDGKVVDCGIGDCAFLEIGGRLFGGGDVTVNVRPRIQKETWSLYWKESMNTETDCLDDFTMTVDDSNSVEAFQREIATRMGWQPVEKLLRLDGFDEKWERMLLKGRELSETKTLSDCGIASNATVVAIRKELIAEGKVKKTTTKLPQDDFVFGMKSFGDCEGARDITMMWQEHVPNPDVKPGPDYIAMNKLAAIRGLTDSKSLRSFRTQNPLTIKRKDSSSRSSSFTTKLQNKVFGMESRYRSAEKIRNYGEEEPYLQHVIQGAFQDAWIRENIKKKKADGRSPRIFEATPTRASNGHAQGASQRLKISHSYSRIIHSSLTSTSDQNPNSFGGPIRHRLKELTDALQGVHTPFDATAPIPEQSVSTDWTNGPDLVLAKTMAHFSSIAYCANRDAVKNWNCSRCDAPEIRDFNLTFAQFIDRWDVFAYIGYSPSLASLVLAFKGTNSSDWRNWLEDVNAWRYHYPASEGRGSHCLMHSGFLAVWELAFKSIVFTQMETSMKFHGTVTPIYVTGHSLGGALAQIAALSLTRQFPQSEINVFSFGSPRIGNKACADYINIQIGANWRFTHMKDLVPSLPGTLGGLYWHPAREVWQIEVVDAKGETKEAFILCDDSGEDPNCHSGACPQDLGCLSIADHLTYLGLPMMSQNEKC